MICKTKEAFLDVNTGPYLDLMPPFANGGIIHQDYVGGHGNVGGDFVLSIGQFPAAEG